ncbi:hypothetical protein BDF22DRAFT_772244 [Syncephalis plumigaleata]|nr:hypothetical protein BDF22DRAFT_772244 [Syncephalis plumigaleata]
MGSSQSRPADQANSSNAAAPDSPALQDYLERARTTAQSKLDQILYDTTATESTQTTNDTEAETSGTKEANKEQSWSEMFDRFGAPPREEQAAILAQAQASYYQARRIKDRALDNCADVHADLRECFRSGSWRDWLTMCEFRRSAFWNCVSRQETILRKLNYAGREDTTPEEDLEIAMEADRIGREQQAAEEQAATS